MRYTIKKMHKHLHALHTSPIIFIVNYIEYNYVLYPYKKEELLYTQKKAGTKVPALIRRNISCINTKLIYHYQR